MMHNRFMYLSEAILVLFIHKITTSDVCPTQHPSSAFVTQNQFYFFLPLPHRLK